MTIKSRDKVEILNENGNVIAEGTVINYNVFREPGMEYAVDVNGVDDVYFFGEKNLRKIEKESK